MVTQITANIVKEEINKINKRLDEITFLNNFIIISVIVFTILLILVFFLSESNLLIIIPYILVLYFLVNFKFKNDEKNQLIKFKKLLEQIN